MNTEKIAGYYLQEKLGSGSFGTVFKAEKVVAGVTVTKAIKALENGDDKVRRMNKNEISVLQEYRHENIVCLHDVQETEKHLYLILDFCEGGNLKQLIQTRKSGKLSEPLIRWLMRDLGAGLKFLHHKKILHRDIKPQNLLLTGPVPLVLDGEELDDSARSEEEEEKRRERNLPANRFSLKIADFGFARSLCPDSLAKSECGTLYYMAPEIKLGHGHGMEADIYSTGKVLLEMITGAPSATAPDETDLPNILDEASMSKRCLPLLELCLKKVPEDRSPERFFQACDDFVNAGSSLRENDSNEEISTDAFCKSNPSGTISVLQNELNLENIVRCAINGAQSNNKPMDSPYSKICIEDKLAKEFGNEKDCSEWVVKLDKELKVQSFYAIKAIRKGGKYDWDSIVSAMNNTKELVKVPGSHKHKSDRWESENFAYFKIDGSPDPDKAHQIQAWFRKCIGDIDASIYENSALVRDRVILRLAEIASETGARIDSAETFIAKEQSRSEKVLEVSMIRFPDKANPHVKLCRIKIFSWYRSVRRLFVQKDRAGFEFECDVMEFKLVDGLVERVNNEQLEKITNKLNDSSTFDF